MMKVRWWMGLAGLLIIGTMLLPVPVLVLAEQHGSSASLLIPLIYGKDFTLEYVHSVQKTPVIEFFTVTADNKLRLTATQYQSYGVGSPFLAEEGSLAIIDGKFELTDIDRVFPEIIIGYVPIARQSIRYNGRLYGLQDYYAAGSLIKIQAQSQRLVKVIISQGTYYLKKGKSKI